MNDDMSETSNVYAFHSQYRIARITWFYFLSALLSEKDYTYNNVFMNLY